MLRKYFFFGLFLFLFIGTLYAQKQFEDFQKIGAIVGTKSSQYEFLKKVPRNPRICISLFDQRTDKKSKEYYNDITTSFFVFFKNYFSSFSAINNVNLEIGGNISPDKALLTNLKNDRDIDLYLLVEVKFHGYKFGRLFSDPYYYLN